VELTKDHIYRWRQTGYNDV